MVKTKKCEETKPTEETNEENKTVCGCGRTKKKPYCDGSHNQCTDEEN